MQGGQGTPEKRNLTQSWRSRGSLAGFLAESNLPSVTWRTEVQGRNSLICLSWLQPQQLLLQDPCHWGPNNGVPVNDTECSASDQSGVNMEMLHSGTITSLTPSWNAVHILMTQGVCPTSKRSLYLAKWGSMKKARVNFTPSPLESSLLLSVPGSCHSILFAKWETEEPSKAVYGHT